MPGIISIAGKLSSILEYGNGNASTIHIFNSNTYVSLKIYRKGCKVPSNCHSFYPMRLVRFPGQLQSQVLSEPLATSDLYRSMETGMLLLS